jgi:hypothetical protein
MVNAAPPIELLASEDGWEETGMSKICAGSALHSASNNFREASASNVPVRMAVARVFNFREIAGIYVDFI